MIAVAPVEKIQFVLRKLLRVGYVILFALFLPGTFQFGLLIYKSSKPADLEVDGIVVFTGDENRIQAGIEKLKQGKAKRMLISGVHEGLTINQIATNLSDDLPIDLGYEAKNTEGNAEETAKWIAKNNFKSIMLITSFYHIPRSMIELQSKLKGIKIIPSSVYSENSKIFNQETDEINYKTIKKLLIEFVGFLYLSTKLLFLEVSKLL